MGKLVTIIGPSGVGKTALVRALANQGRFATALEGHEERPFQTLFKQDRRYGLANQVDYFLLRAEQERALRAAPQTGLIDGGLDLDYHGFTRLFRARGLLTDPEFDLCRRLYETLRGLMPLPELIVRLRADQETVAGRLSARERINIAMTPPEQVEYEREVADLKENVGQNEFASCWAEGRAMTMEQTIEFALETADE